MHQVRSEGTEEKGGACDSLFEVLVPGALDGDPRSQPAL